MANLPESNDALPPPSNDREDSGLQDILAVAAKIKDAPAEPAGDEGDSEREDSGLIMFSSGGLGGSDEAEQDDALFGSFSGGLAAGFGTSVDPLSSPDLVPLGGEGSVREGTAAELRSKPAEEPKRNPLTVVAVVLGMCLVAAGAVYLTNKDSEQPPPQAQAEMSAKPDGEAAVGSDQAAPEDPAAAAGAGAGQAGEAAAEPQPAGEAEAGEGEAAEAGLIGDDALAMADSGEGDPMAVKQGLLDGGSNPVAKAGKWDQGQASDEPDDQPDPVAPQPKSDPQPDPEPDPIVAPEPKKPAGGGGSDDEVDCLLNPDLPKCNTGGTSKPKDDTVLAPKIPDKLDSNQLRDGFNTVKSKAKACGSKHGAAAGTKVKIHASIEGASGKITSVEAQGEHAGTDLGKCVEDAVKGATFEVFKKPSQGVDYSMIM